MANLKCGGCEKGVKDALTKLGMEHVEVSSLEGTVSFDGERERAVAELTRLGYPLEGSEEAKSLLRKGKSYVTCMAGRMQKDK